MSTKLKATIITAGFLVLLTLILVGLWLFMQGRYLSAEARRKVFIGTNLMSEAAREPLAEGNILALARMADRTIERRDISRVIVADSRGVVLVDTERTAYGTSPEIIRQAMQGRRVFIAYRPDNWIGTRSVVGGSDLVLGAVAVEFPTDTLLAAQRSAQIGGILIALLGIVAGSVLAFLAAQLLTQPLENLLVGIRHVQAGEPGAPVPMAGTPEFAEIGHAFNEMAGAVRERVHQLELLNQMAAGLSLSKDLQEAATAIRYSSISMLAAKSYAWVLDPSTRMLVPVPAKNERAIGEPVSTACEYPVGRAFSEKRVLLVGEDAPDYPADTEIIVGLTVKSAVIAPMSTADGVVGVLVITKPDGRRFVTEEDETLVRAMANVAAPVIMARLRAQSQARAAAALQSILVPETPPGTGVDTYTAYRPAEEIGGLGGDYYDFIPLGPSKCAIVVGDASGKGLEAARYAAMTKYVVRSYVLEYCDAAETMLWSNRALAAQEQPGNFITMFCAILNTDDYTLSYSNAGHLPPLLYKYTAKNVRQLDPSGIALGITEDASFTNNMVKLESGDILCIFTDGVTESRRDGEWFGEQRIIDVLSTCPDLSSREIGDRVMSEVTSFMEGKFKDDIVLVVLKMP